MASPQKRPKIRRPMMSTSKDSRLLLANIKQALMMDKMFTIRMEFRLIEKGGHIQ